MTISVLILTKNEAQDLPGCLASAQWSDDIHVLDSESADNTVEIANTFGAKVTIRKFDGYASQRNFGLGLPYKYPWLLILDADERVSTQLVNEMQAFVSQAEDEIGAARMMRRDMWGGAWLKHAQLSPLFIRLVKIGKVRYEREINEVLIVDGKTYDLSEPFDHYPFSKGLSHWLNKHNAYSSKEAETIVKGLVMSPSLKAALFDADFNTRRMHQKAIFYRMPARPMVKFIYMMLYRRAFLDGMAGIRYSILQSMYEYHIVLKVKELQKHNENTDIQR